MRNLTVKLFALFLFGFFNEVEAQEYISIQYTAAIPLNGLRDHIEEVSFRGVTMEYFSKISPDIAAGVSIGWNGFYEKMPFATYQDGTSSISGIQFRYGTSVPIHINGFYFLGKEAGLNPFIGLGVGTIYTDFDTDIGLYNMGKNSWNFSVRPEIGFLYTFFDTLRSKFALRYNKAFDTSAIKDPTSFSLSLGVVLVK
jgi:hypothetical protein